MAKITIPNPQKDRLGSKSLAQSLSLVTVLLKKTWLFTGLLWFIASRSFIAFLEFMFYVTKFAFYTSYKNQLPKMIESPSWRKSPIADSKTKNDAQSNVVPKKIFQCGIRYFFYFSVSTAMSLNKGIVAYLEQNWHNGK